MPAYVVKVRIALDADGRDVRDKIERSVRQALRDPSVEAAVREALADESPDLAGAKVAIDVAWVMDARDGRVDEDLVDPGPL